MDFKLKDDFIDARKRVEAWWEGEIIDRVPIIITSPVDNAKKYDNWINASAFPLTGFWNGLLKEYEEIDDLESFYTDHNIILARNQKLINETIWGGEAIPVMFPVSMVAVLAHYLGSPIKYVNTHTTWAEPIIDSWEERQVFSFNPYNDLWIKSKNLLKKAAEDALGNYIIGIPDLNGPGEILSILRGNERLAIDTIDNPEEIIKAMEEINICWYRYWQECHDIIHKSCISYTNYMSIWSDRPATDLQCDFSALISPQSFNRFFIPFLEQQIMWVSRNIYHLDGPEALVHLDSLLSIPDLKAIEWVPGAGNAPMSQWTELLQKIQNAGKLLSIACEKWEVEKLVKELEPEKLLLHTTCGSEKEMEEIIENVRKWT